MQEQNGGEKTLGREKTPADDAFTVVLTSCGRFDLLRATVESLVRHIDEQPSAFILIEDSGDASVRNVVADLEQRLALGFTFLINRRQRGQMSAVDRAYAAVKTPFIFHCEDDWEFFQSGFIKPSRAILNARPDVSMVGLRPRFELNALIRETPAETLNDIAFFTLDPTKHPEYFGYSFNPGLRRTADARAIGSFAALGQEPDVSYAFKQRGFRIANLETASVRHLGDVRHVKDPTSPDKPKTLMQRLRRSFKKRLKRLKRNFG